MTVTKNNHGVTILISIFSHPNDFRFKQHMSTSRGKQTRENVFGLCLTQMAVSKRNVFSSIVAQKRGCMRVMKV